MLKETHEELYQKLYESGFSPWLDKKDILPVIIDHATGLIWQQSGSDLRMNFNDAKNYIEKLNELGYPMDVDAIQIPGEGYVHKYLRAVRSI